MRKALVVGGMLFGVGVVLIAVGVGAFVLFGQPRPGGGQELNGALAAVAGLSLLGGLALLVLSVPVGIVVWGVSARLESSAPATLGPPPAPGFLTNSPLIVSSTSRDDLAGPGSALPPPDAEDLIEPSAPGRRLVVHEYEAAPRGPLWLRLVTATLVTGLASVLVWTQMLGPTVGEYLFLDGVETVATVSDVTVGSACRVTLEYVVDGATVSSPGAEAGPSECTLSVGDQEQIVYSESNPSLWRYPGLSAPWVLVAGATAFLSLFWLGIVFGKKRRRTVLTLQ